MLSDAVVRREMQRKKEKGQMPWEGGWGRGWLMSEVMLEGSPCMFGVFHTFIQSSSYPCQGD